LNDDGAGGGGARSGEDGKGELACSRVLRSLDDSIFECVHFLNSKVAAAAAAAAAAADRQRRQELLFG